MLGSLVRRTAAPVREVARAVVLAWMAAACTTLQPRPLTSADSASPRAYEHASVTLNDGTRLELRRAIVANDSVSGIRANGRQHDRVSVPIASVRSIEQRQISAGRTTLLVAGIALVALATLVLIAISNMDYGLGDVRLGIT